LKGDGKKLNGRHLEDSDRFSYLLLEKLVGGTDGHQAEVLQTTRRTIQRLRHGPGLNWVQADVYAVRAGYTPEVVWPWWLDLLIDRTAAMEMAARATAQVELERAEQLVQREMTLRARRAERDARRRVDSLNDGWRWEYPLLRVDEASCCVARRDPDGRYPIGYCAPDCQRRPRLVPVG
jgi:hypothetical protein